MSLDLQPFVSVFLCNLFLGVGVVVFALLRFVAPRDVVSPLYWRNLGWVGDVDGFWERVVLMSVAFGVVVSSGTLGPVGGLLKMTGVVAWVQLTLCLAVSDRSGLFERVGVLVRRGARALLEPAEGLSETKEML